MRIEKKSPKMPDTLGLQAHHVGCLTDDMDKSISNYKAMGFIDISPVYTITSQKVQVCFIAIREAFYLELVAFSPESPSLKRIFKSGNPYYHIGYLVPDIAATITQLESLGHRMVGRFASEAFNGKTCAFLYSPEMHLIELIGS